MLETIKVRLKAYTKAAGITLSNTRIDAIADRLSKQFPDLKEEKDIDDKLKELDAVQPFKEIAQYDDYQRGKAAKEKREKEEQQRQQQQQQNGDEDETDDDDDDESEEVKPAAGKKPVKKKRESENTKLLKELLGKVSALESEKKTTSIKQKIINHPKMKDVERDFWDDGLTVIPDKSDDEVIDDFAEKISKKYAGYKQAETNTKGAASTKPQSGTKKDSKEVDKKEVAKIVDELMPGTKKATA